MENKFDYDDITLVPATVSDIDSRQMVNARYNDGCLPLCTAPMDMVISNDNAEVFKFNGIRVVLPRGEKTNDPLIIESLSLTDIIDMYDNDTLNPRGGYLIDIANGHMQKLVYTVRILKERYPDMFLMVGNIANPETYRLLSEAGADAVRCSIGTGGNCTTSVHVAVHYPAASLISECYKVSCTLDKPALIIADGGMKNYSDIIKALALGADYVMIGGLFNKCIESCGDNYLFNRIRVPKWVANWCFLNNIPIYKKMRGMSTKEVQKKWGADRIKTSEGVVRRNKVEYSLSQWTENFEDYLKSAMSYTGKKTLDEFKGNVDYIHITENAFNRFRK